MGALVVNMFTSLDGSCRGPARPTRTAGGGRVRRLVESATFPKGAVHLTYERAGKPTFGSMA